MATMSKVFFTGFWFVEICIHIAVGSLSSNEEVSFSSMTVVRGETAKLPCFLTPDVTKVNWTSENIGLISENWRILPTTERYQIEQNRTRDWILVIKNVQPSDNGVYTCSCSGNSKYEMKVHLNVVDTTVKTTNKIAKTAPSIQASTTSALNSDLHVSTAFTTTAFRMSSDKKASQAASGTCNIWSCTSTILFTLLFCFNTRQII